MQRYRWPDYELELLRILQRQQNHAWFCDTLLQTEGISVPTHSCILAALSPYLSEKLSTSPAPPLGQMRQLHFQEVKAHTLLKLIGLLYSGEVEVKGSLELNDVLSAACRFGITGLVEGRRVLRMERVEPLVHSSRGRKMRDAQVQTEMCGRRAPDCPVGKKDCASTGTQTVGTEENTRCVSSYSGGTRRLPGGVDLLTMQPQNISPDGYSCSSSFRGAPSNDESRLRLSNDKSVRSMSYTKDLSFLMDQDNRSYQRSPGSGSRTDMGSEGSKSNDDMTDEGAIKEWSSHTDKEEEPGEEASNSSEEKKGARASVAKKSLAKMKQMQATGTASDSIKMKLRRRTEGEPWKIVKNHEAVETPSVLTCWRQRDLTNAGSSSVHPDGPDPLHKADTITVPPPEALPRPTPTSHPQPLGTESLDSDRDDGLGSTSLDLPAGPAAESDEHLDKLLEDIMMDLNILPSHGRSCKASPHLGWMQAETAAAGRLSHHLLTDTGTLCSQSGPSITSVSSVSVSRPGGQTPRDPAGQGPPSQPRQDILDLLPGVDELQLPPCLSPLQQPVINGSNRNKVVLQPPEGTAWLTESLVPLRYPLSAMTKTQTPGQDTHQNRSTNRTFRSPPNRGRGAQCRTLTEAGKEGRKSGATPDQKMQESFPCQRGDPEGNSGAPKGKSWRHSSRPLLTSFSVGDGRKTFINLSSCSVSLSTNNILAKERARATSHASGGGPAPGPVISETSRGGGEPDVAQSQLRTRVSLTAAPNSPGNAAPVKAPAHPNEGGISLPRRKRGRPPKVKHDVRPPPIRDRKSAGPESQQQSDSSLLKERDEKGVRRKKRRRSGSEVAIVPPKRSKAADTNEDRSAARKLGGRPQAAPLKKLQHLLKNRQPRTGVLGSRRAEEPEEPAGNAERKGRTWEGQRGPEMKGRQPLNAHAVLNATVDGNHNVVFSKSSADHNKPGNSSDSSAGRTSVSAGDNCQPFCCDATEERATLAPRRKLLPEEPDEGTGWGTTLLTDVTEQGFSHLDVLTPPEENHTPLEQTSNFMTLDPNPGPPLPHIVGMERSGCHQEEEDELEYVDIELYSPDALRVSKECEPGLRGTDVSPDEEEEDVVEVDVTGDEAE